MLKIPSYHRLLTTKEGVCDATAQTGVVHIIEVDRICERLPYLQLSEPAAIRFYNGTLRDDEWLRLAVRCSCYFEELDLDEYCEVASRYLDYFNLGSESSFEHLATIFSIYASIETRGEFHQRLTALGGRYGRELFAAITKHLAMQRIEQNSVVDLLMAVEKFFIKHVDEAWLRLQWSRHHIEGYDQLMALSRRCLEKEVHLDIAVKMFSVESITLHLSMFPPGVFEEWSLLVKRFDTGEREAVLDRLSETHGRHDGNHMEAFIKALSSGQESPRV